MPGGNPSTAHAARFDEASRDVVAYLRSALPIGTWTVTRFDGERQIYLTVDDADLGVGEGASVAWNDSMCQFIDVTSVGPTVFTDLRSSPEHAAIVDKAALPVHSYIGYPISTSDGALFGTLCGFHRGPFPSSLTGNYPLITLLVSLLARVLDADLSATNAARDLEAAQRRADTDGLTGLVNRNGWERLLEVEDARFGRFADPAAVIIVDLDDLKEVNDSRGHHAGDDRLRETARLMSEVVDLPAVVARIGGDEFAILVSGCGRAATEDLARRLRAVLSAHDISASVGHAPYTVIDGLDGAWRAADAAMYAEKLARRTAG